MFQYKYRQTALKIHPDKRSTDPDVTQKATEQFQQVQQAKAFLETWYKEHPKHEGWESDEFKAYKASTAKPKAQAAPRGRKFSEHFTTPTPQAKRRPRLERQSNPGAGVPKRTKLEPVASGKASSALVPAATGTIVPA